MGLDCTLVLELGQALDCLNAGFLWNVFSENGATEAMESVQARGAQ